MASKEQREKRRMKRQKSRRRLKSVQVNEISLVDRPAVPQAVFTVAKRDEEGDEIMETTVEKTEVIATDGSDTVVLVKSREDVADAFIAAIDEIRAVAGDLTPQGLHMLASLLEFTQHMYGDIPQVIGILRKCEDDDDPDEDVIHKIHTAAALSSELSLLMSDIEQSDPDGSITLEVSKSLGIELPSNDDDSESTVVEKTEVVEDGTAIETETDSAIDILEQAGNMLIEKQQKKASNETDERIAKISELLNSTAETVNKSLERADSLVAKLDRAHGKVSA